MAERKMWINRETLVGIADAIRSKKGTNKEIPVPELKDEILSIEGGGGEAIPDFDESEDFRVFVEGLEGEVNIGYSVSQKVALPEGSPARLASVSDENFIASNIKKGVSVFGLEGAYEGEGGEDSAIPIEISTEAEMTSLLTSGEVGAVYKYTGETGTYENGALYVIETTD